jgi:aryl-alcohol dehydrogenase-like predicted oxidoreductase
VKLVLGTVQFGLDYGITNQDGKPSQKTVSEILEVARSNNIELLDSASGYGDSEDRLGKLFDQSKSFEITSKTPNWNGSPPADCAEQVRKTFVTSQKNLHRKRLTGLMVHFARDLLSAQGVEIWGTLSELKSNGDIDHAGISFYADDPIEDLINKYSPDFIQVPVNVLDQRLLNNGLLKQIRDKGIEIHVRSVFLQGVILTPLTRLPAQFSELADVLGKFTRICQREKMSQLEGALNFVKSIKEVSSVVVGVTTPGELQNICEAFNRHPGKFVDWASTQCDVPELIDPRFWQPR